VSQPKAAAAGLAFSLAQLPGNLGLIPIGRLFHRLHGLPDHKPTLRVEGRKDVLGLSSTLSEPKICESTLSRQVNRVARSDLLECVLRGNEGPDESGGEFEVDQVMLLQNRFGLAGKLFTGNDNMLA